MILPVTQDRDSGPFFAAAAEGRLVVKACTSCGRGIHPPVPHCPNCGSAATEWREASGLGTLHAWTRVVHQVHPDYPTPFTLAVVALDDVPEVRLVGRLDGDAVLEDGQAMRVWFEPAGEGVTLPNWRPAL